MHLTSSLMLENAPGHFPAFEEVTLKWCSLTNVYCWKPEVESLRTHFEVLGLGLEASSPQKLPYPRLEDSTIFEPLKFRWKTP